MTTWELPSRALTHPLPAGMRDLLPDEARRRRALARRILDHFELFGYHLVTPPAFEFADVLERGLGALDPSDVLRFVEPESGEVAALLPDVTPQIARMVATRLAREPLPIRLCYEGTIVRRRQGRARRERQVPQAGVELYGLGALAGDVEILELCAGAVRAAGLYGFVIDLGHASIARSLVDALPAPMRASMGEALEAKDAQGIESLTKECSVPPEIARALAGLPDLYGGGPGDMSAQVALQRAATLLEGTPAAAPLAELVALHEAAGASLGEVLRVDLGAVRGLAYYTGAVFQVFAAGPGEAIAAGGRYDELLGRFDAPMPAVGFAIHLEALAWACKERGPADERVARVVVVDAPGASELATALRSRGVAAIVYEETGAASYAAAWGFTHLATASPTFAVTPLGSLAAGGVIVPLGADAQSAARAFVTLYASEKEER